MKGSLDDSLFQILQFVGFKFSVLFLFMFRYLFLLYRLFRLPGSALRLLLR